MTTVTRLSLIERIRDSKDEEHWNLFARIYDGLILGWLRKQGVSAEDAEDVRQEVMSTVYQEITKFKHNGRTGAFRSWLRMITSNRLQRLWRKRKSTARAVDSQQLEQLASQLADEKSRLTLIWDEQHDAYVLKSLLGELSARFKPQSINIFQRVALEQESAAQVAEDLGISLGTARVAQHRVFRALKALGQDLLG